MTSNHDESGEDTTSSLGDASYDFIDDRSNVTTDDEDQDAMTASTTSSDEHAFEHVDIPPASRELSDPPNPSSRNNMPVDSAAREAQPFGSRSISSSQGSEQCLANDSESHDDHEVIEFEEPSVTNLNSSRFTEVSHTLKILEKHGHLHNPNSNAVDRLRSQVAITVRQTMTSHNLSVKNGQYKVLYVGSSSVREPIIQKIGTALAAGLTHSTLESERARSSRFSVVPISAFGEDSSPEVVLIDSSGLELTVEDCSFICARKDIGNDALRMELSDGTLVDSLWDGSKFEVSNNWKLPDIAIFCLSDDDDFAKKPTRQLARSFMSRHKIPSMVISQGSLWDKPHADPITLDFLTPHVCLESRKLSFLNTHIIRRVPIDLTTFLNIDAGQMNRNLACLATARSSMSLQQNPKESLKQDRAQLITSGRWPLMRAVHDAVDDLRNDGFKNLDWYHRIAASAVVLTSAFVMLLVGFGLSELLGASKVSTSRVFPTQGSMSTTWSSRAPLNHLAPPFSSLISRPPSSTPTLVPSSEVPSSTHVPIGKSSSSNTDIAAFLLDTYVLAPNKSEQFKVHVLGDCHIVLRPPHWFSKMKKSPTLFFKVLRGATELEHQTTMLFDGVYALQVAREDAYGSLTVEVWTQSKPIVNENFEVNFGPSWLKAAGWKKATRALTEAIRDDMQSVQTSLSTVYDHTKSGLSTFVQQRRSKMVARKAAEKASLQSHLKAAIKTKALIVAQTRGLQRGLAIKLYSTRTAASARIKAKAGKITKDLVLYTRNKTTTMSHQARLVARSVISLDLKGTAQSVGEARRAHLREMQKRTLKNWWKVCGLPKQKKKRVNVEARRP